MQPVPPEIPDRLEQARRIALGLAVASLVLLGLVIALSWSWSARALDQQARWVESLSIDQLAILPAGRPERHRSLHHRGVQLEQSPELAPTRPDWANRFLRPPRRPEERSQ